MYNSDELRLFSQKARNGLCSHAYIVDGDAGIGKLDFALECARALLCTERDKPCGYCQGCRKVLSNEHPDVYIIGREKTAAIADVRELIRRSFLKPNDSDRQIFIVNNAGKLREDSQNALLKLFEEPPESVTIFLLTESRSSLLPTVLSRAQRIHLDGMRDFEIAEKLRECYPELREREINTAIDIARGNLGTALKYLSKESAATRLKAEKLLVYALSKQSYELTGALLLPKYKREQLAAVLYELTVLLNEAEKMKYGVPKYNLPQSPELLELVKGASKKALAKMGESAFLCMTALENNANVTAAASKLAIELLSAASR
ncbi:MAG: hypothetical protein IKM32_04875 [Clostridia bacterium]|nr:hypothetical protein [Clostridia bacterium]